MKELAVTAAFAPLVGALIAGLGGRWLTRQGAHTAAIFSVLLSFLASCVIFWRVLGGETYNGTVYTWLTSDTYRFQVGFLIDRLTALMMVVVTFVSLMVHIYTIGYMAEDPGYKRFYSYIALFTFCMLMLVMANNYVQLFFDWEGVGLVSYLLIGFWYTRESAV
ncbi:MAG: NADH-quinone oxidoreductase subunit L, partial [Betaproteobacteria bacterium]